MCSTQTAANPRARPQAPHGGCSIAAECNGYGVLRRISFSVDLQGFSVELELELFRVPSEPIPQLEVRTLRKSPRPAVMTRASGTQLPCGGCMTIISLIDVVSLVLTAIGVGITIGGQLRP